MYKHISCFGERKITQCNLTVKQFYDYIFIIHQEIVSLIEMQTCVIILWKSRNTYLWHFPVCLVGFLLLYSEIASWCKMFIFFSKYQVCFPGKLRTSVREQKKANYCVESEWCASSFLTRFGTVFFTFQSFTLVRRLIGNVIQLKTVQMKTYLLPLQYLMLILVKFPSSIDHDLQTRAVWMNFEPCLTQPTFLERKVSASVSFRFW